MQYTKKVSHELTGITEEELSLLRLGMSFLSTNLENKVKVAGDASIKAVYIDRLSMALRISEQLAEKVQPGLLDKTKQIIGGMTE